MKKVFIILLLVLISGCAKISKKVNPVENVDMNKAYIFGGFQESNCHGGAVGLEIVGRTKKNKYVLKSQRNMAANLYSILPGEYRLANLLALSLGNQIEGKIPLKGFPYDTKFEAKAGIAYYIGNHSGSCSFGMSGLFMNLEWVITFKGLDYDKAVSELSKSYPNFRAIEMVSAFNSRINKP